MQTKHLCVLINISTKIEAGAVKRISSKVSFTDRSKTVLLLWIILLFMFRVCHAFLSVQCSLVITCWERANQLALLCVWCYVMCCRFPVWCPGSGMVLDCIDS